jgi:hypothetical protein
MRQTGPYSKQQTRGGPSRHRHPPSVPSVCVAETGLRGRLSPGHLCKRSHRFVNAFWGRVGSCKDHDKPLLGSQLVGLELGRGSPLSEPAAARRAWTTHLRPVGGRLPDQRRAQYGDPTRGPQPRIVDTAPPALPGSARVMEPSNGRFPPPVTLHRTSLFWKSAVIRLGPGLQWLKLSQAGRGVCLRRLHA